MSLELNEVGILWNIQLSLAEPTCGMHFLTRTLEVMNYNLGLWSRDCLQNTTLNVSHVLLPGLYVYFALM